MPHDKRVVSASAKLAAAHRRKNATPRDRDEARRDLCAAQIAVSIDRALAASPLPLTNEQTAEFVTRLGLGWPAGDAPDLIDEPLVTDALRDLLAAQIRDEEEDILVASVKFAIAKALCSQHRRVPESRLREINLFTTQAVLAGGSE